MITKFTFGTAAAVALLLSSAAFAEESVSVLGSTALQICAGAAAAASHGGVVGSTGLTPCTAAIAQESLTRNDLAAAYLNRGVLYLARSDYTHAIADDDAALRIRGDLAEAYANRGAASAGLRRYSDAAADFTQALALSPEKPETIYFDRALAREDLGDLKGAYLDYRKAAELAPGWELPKQQLARFTVGHAAQS
jgi:tetratricopeptide (TPR) repeat protein